MGEFWNFHLLGMRLLKELRMKQILKVRFEEQLTLTVVLNIFGHLELRQNESMSLTTSSYSVPSNPQVPQVSHVNVIWAWLVREDEV